MDVNINNFQSQLPSIVEAIANSRVVSIDLELSGIPGRQSGQARTPGRSDDGRQTLQERYEENKRAAERYQILQLGLTCVEEDLKRGVYTTRTYNFLMNPVTDKRLGVERDFMFQSGAVEFLMSVNFQMEAPFKKGVPYFSRQEEAQARSIATARQDKSSIEDLHVPVDDTDTVNFVQRAREETTEWVKVWRIQGTSATTFLNIAPLNHGSPNYNGRGLNGFQKRLVHQLIRAEFPDVVSISKPEFIQLIPYDKKREDAQSQKKVAWFDRSLTSQIGLRWVAEALCPNVHRVLPAELKAPNASGDLAAIANGGWIYPSSPIPELKKNLIASKFEKTLHKLKAKRTILVGHNLFIDLIYFFTCFFGPLPDRVEEFQSIVGQLFPLVFDTKYLADKINDNSPHYRSSLEDIDQELSKLLIPVIEIPPEHNKYDFGSPVHEAGFDSFLTARVLIRLSTKTEAERNSGADAPDAESEASLSASEDGGVVLTAEQLKRATLHPSGKAGPYTYSDSNPFAALRNQGLEDVPPHTMMPHEHSPFWLQYGNKLRVNGTIEGACIIPIIR